MNKQRLINEIFQGLLMVAIVALALPGLALAQTAGEANLGAEAPDLTTQVGLIAPLISALFWLGGAVMMGAGALKLKEHAEDPTRAPLRQGISRMAVGAALLTIPFFAQFVVATLGAGSTAVSYTAFTAPGTAV
jgi:hypothetical protein